MKSALTVIAQKASPTLSRTIGRGGLKFKKQGPNIMFGVGVVGTVASTVLACRATLRLPAVLDEVRKEIEEVKEPAGANYPREEIGRDLAYVYGKSVGKLGRLYGPSFAIGVVSIGLISRSHYNLARQNANLMAAYAALQAGYDSYRDRVRNELGVDRELDLFRGLVAGGESKDDEVPCLTDPNQMSPYSRLFDEYSSHWVKDPELNRLYVQCQQNYANELLRARGHLFLNEVYDMLGLERSQAGQVVGWVIGDEGDNYVDFGMYAPQNSGFINGWERSILLDFNVDGVVFDKI